MHDVLSVMFSLSDRENYTGFCILVLFMDIKYVELTYTYSIGPPKSMPEPDAAL